MRLPTEARAASDPQPSLCGAILLAVLPGGPDERAEDNDGRKHHADGGDDESGGVHKRPSAELERLDRAVGDRPAGELVACDRIDEIRAPLPEPDVLDIRAGRPRRC